MGTVTQTAAAAALPPLRTWREHGAATLKLGLPLAGAQLTQMIIYTTDTVMIGWLGARELAASVLGAQALFVVLMFGSGFAMAIMPLVAQAMGAGDVRAARRAARMGLWIATIYSLALMLPLWNMGAILVALGQEPELAQMAQDYTRILQWSLIPALYILVLRSFLSAVEHTRIVLVATITAAIVNALLNYALIFGNFGAPKLDLVGAAIASVLSNLLALAILISYARVSEAVARFEVFVRLWRADWPAFFEVLQLGWPISLTVIAEVGLFAASSVMIGWIGTIELAAHGIALQLASLAFMIPLGLSAAATVRVGQARGQGDPANLHRAAVSVLVIALGIAFFSAALFVLLPAPLISLFLDEANPDAANVLAFAIPLLAVAAAFQLVDSTQAVSAGLLRGIKDTRIPMFIAVFGYWCIGLSAGYLLAFSLDLGAVGIWMGLAIGLAVVAVMLTWRFFLAVSGNTTGSGIAAAA